MIILSKRKGKFQIKKVVRGQLRHLARQRRSIASIKFSVNQIDVIMYEDVYGGDRHLCGDEG